MFSLHMVLESKLLDSRLVQGLIIFLSVIILLELADVFYSEYEILKRSSGYIG